MSRSYSGHLAPVLLEGRIDVQLPVGPVLIWQASRIRFAFEGNTLTLELAVLEGCAGLTLSIDGAVERLHLRKPGAHAVIRTVLASGCHEVVLTKLSEASAGWVALSGITVDGELVGPTAPTFPCRFEFFGDSITVGACDEDGALDQWDDRTLHNGMRSYAALCAEEFKADFRSTAVSGMGVSTGFFELQASQVWDRLYPQINSPRADLKSWTPDLVFINWGENDHAYPVATGKDFPDDFTERYVDVVRRIRSAYTRATLILLRGGMAGGAKSRPLIKAWTRAVEEIQASDERVHRFVFSHWTEQHPRASDHVLMARELSDWLARSRAVSG